MSIALDSCQLGHMAKEKEDSHLNTQSQLFARVGDKWEDISVTRISRCHMFSLAKQTNLNRTPKPMVNW